ncbi:unnamed protein product [Triticum aestivum]|uniref:Uncharacterized protein n=1 Tax=Triticum aestivum TaxID=4565 RepID=A0A7H4LN15_WHEAT|nr:unnamed protein product [Triticum aestivum]
MMYFDGSFSLQGAGAGVLLVAPTGEHLKYVFQMHFPREQATNNTAEYEGLLAGLRIAADLGIKKLIVRGDSQLVVRQVNKDYQSPLMEAYIDEVRKLEEHFDGLQMEHVPRAENDIADGLSWCASLKLPVEPRIFVLKLTQPSVTPSTRQSKKRKLISGDYFPAELPEAATKKVPRIDNKGAEGQSAPASHRVCSVEADAPDKLCSGKLAGEHQAPAEPQVLAVEVDVPAAADVPLVLVVEPEAPAWAQPIVRFLRTGELPEEQEEAERVAWQSMRKVTAQSAVKFFRSIVCRFGIPNRIITDNGTQFTSPTFMQYVQDLGAKVCFASVAHPRSNGQAERANAEVLRGLKTRTFDRLHNCRKNWIEELPVVLWSIRTTPNRATGQTPFALVYGAEAVLPTELVYGSPRVLSYDELEQEQLREDDALLLEEDRL